MIEEQLILWEEPLEIRLNRRMLAFEERMEDKNNRQRKSQFAKIGSVTKLCNEMQHDFEQWKSFLCKSSYSEDISLLKEEVNELRLIISGMLHESKAEIFEMSL